MLKLRLLFLERLMSQTGICLGPSHCMSTAVCSHFSPLRSAELVHGPNHCETENCILCRRCALVQYKHMLAFYSNFFSFDVREPEVALLHSNAGCLPLMTGVGRGMALWRTHLVFPIFFSRIVWYLHGSSSSRRVSKIPPVDVRRPFWVQFCFPAVLALLDMVVHDSGPD